jgi:uncharacterized protein YegL
MDGARAKILPFYLVIDVSASMAGSKLHAVNSVVPTLLDALAQNPILSDKVRVCVIDFAEDAQVVLPLCDILDPSLTIPALRTRGSTSYTAALTSLREQIGRDVAQLKVDGYVVHRPAAFFLSDGKPMDAEHSWGEALRLLILEKTHPNIIPFGVDGANPKVLQNLIYPSSGPRAMHMYLTSSGTDPAEAIAAFAEVLVSSMISSGQSLSAGESGIILPDRSDLPTGVSQYSADDFI